MEITVRFSITRYGNVFGKASIRYESRDASDDERLAYRIAVAQAIERCTPFPITEGFSSAIAGHPLNIKFTSRRKQRQAGLAMAEDRRCNSVAMYRGRGLVVAGCSPDRRSQ
jgi:hypothetical protein